MKLILLIFFLSFWSIFSSKRTVNSEDIKSGKIHFMYHNTIKEDEIFEGVNYFDNFGETTLTIFNEKRGTSILKSLKQDSTNYIYDESQIWYPIQRNAEILIDPIIELTGEDSYNGEYKTTNKRDTIFNNLNCSAYDLIFTDDKSKAILVTYKNIKMYYQYNSGNLIEMYSVTSFDTTITEDKTKLFNPSNKK